MTVVAHPVPGTIILHNGVHRTFRDKRETAFEAARYAKSKARGDIIELCDCSTGEKLVMLADGRVGSLSTCPTV
jgi:hypothetical protein